MFPFSFKFSSDLSPSFTAADKDKILECLKWSMRAEGAIDVKIKDDRVVFYGFMASVSKWSAMSRIGKGELILGGDGPLTLTLVNTSYLQGIIFCVMSLVGIVLLVSGTYMGLLFVFVMLINVAISVALQESWFRGIADSVVIRSNLDKEY